MIRLSIIYALLTIGPLAFIDAIRIKIGIKNKKANINHTVSVLFAGIGVIAAILLIGKVQHLRYFTLAPLVITVLVICMAATIRLALYDMALNLWRILFKINPTMRLDYESFTTSSWFDKHSEELSFWQKRGLAVLGYAAVLFVYYKIF